jgi:O-antigen/teichoic acid export membrane protein
MMSEAAATSAAKIRPARGLRRLTQPVAVRPSKEVGALAARGAMALGGRQVVAWVVNFGAGVVLARLLTPADFGIYAIAAFVLTAFTAFGDGGLGASLVQQEEEPTPHDYRRVFCVQQLIVGSVVLLVWALASVIVALYGLKPEYAWFIRLMALSLLITSFATISVTRLERWLAFGRIGVISAIESATFSLTAVGLALAGAGVYSFGIAMVAQATVAVVLYTLAAPWPIGWERPTSELKARLAFGIPYQGVGVVSLIKDSISPLFVGLLLGATSVGYVKWSQTLAAYLLFAVQVLNRLFMPTFSRLQSDPQRLRRAVESVLMAANAVVAPAAMITLVLAQPITHLVYGEKWAPALPVFYAFWFANVFVPTASPMMALLNALGDTRTGFAFAVFWMVGTWALGVPLVLAFGIFGFGIANAVIQFSNIYLCRRARQRLQFSIVRPVGRPWLLAAMAMVPTLALQLLAPAHTVPMLLGYAALAGALYLFATTRFEADRVAQLGRLLGVRLPFVGKVAA